MTVLLDIIIVLVLAETGVIVWQRFSRGEASELPFDLANLASGLCLMLAVRLAWTNSPGFLVILLVTLAGVAHAFDMARHFQTRKKTPQIGASETVPEPQQPPIRQDASLETR